MGEVAHDLVEFFDLLAQFDYQDKIKAMKRIVLVHGWDGSPEADWFPWVIDTLKSKGYEVLAPYMPNPEVPDIDAWVTYLANEVKVYDENTIFVGHSIGCQTIMRYFEHQNTKAKGAIFVAGWFNLVNLENEDSEKIAEPWIKTPINTGKVKDNLGSTVAILGDNDQWVPLEETRKAFEDLLDSKVIVIPNGGHITEDDGYGEFPELIKQIEAL
jgi:uncharacterized protein